MDMAIPANDDKNFGKILAIKQSVAQGILTASVRVRQDSLRPAQADHMAGILAEVKARRRLQAAEQPHDQVGGAEDDQQAGDHGDHGGDGVLPGAELDDAALTAALFDGL